MQLTHYDVEADFFAGNRVELQEWMVVSAHRILAPWIKDRFKIAYNSPKQFNKTGSVSTGTFLKVLHQIGPKGTLKEDAVLKLVNAFAAKCSRADWEQLYQPILTRKPFRHLTIGAFNNKLLKHEDLSGFPTEYVISLFKPQPFEVGFPTGAGHFYPHGPDASRLFAIIWQTHVEIVQHDFGLPEYWSTYDSPFRKICKQPNITYPLVFEIFVDNFTMVLTDVFPLAHIGTWPGELRRQVLEDFYMEFLSDDSRLVLGEGYPSRGGSADELDNVAQHITDLGYRGLQEVMFKPATTTYAQPALLVPVFPLDGG